MWLFTIAANVLANHRRSRSRRLALADSVRQQIALGQTSSDFAESVAVRDAVLRLRDAHRELVMLIHWDGFTILEAAEILGVNPSTARSRYGVARAALRQALADFDAAKIDVSGAARIGAQPDRCGSSGLPVRGYRTR